MQIHSLIMETIHSLSLDRTNHKVLSLIDNSDLVNQSILDVGAGEGYFSLCFGDLLVHKYHCLPKDHLQVCDLNPQDFRYTEIECRYTDLRNPLPYNDNQFDIIASIEVIEHLENQFQFVRELHRITKSQGRVSVFFSRFFYSLIWIHYFRFTNKLRKKHPGLYQENKKLLDHLNQFTILASRTIIIEGFK